MVPAGGISPLDSVVFDGQTNLAIWMKGASRPPERDDESSGIPVGKRVDFGESWATTPALVQRSDDLPAWPSLRSASIQSPWKDQPVGFHCGFRAMSPCVL